MKRIVSLDVVTQEQTRLAITTAARHGNTEVNAFTLLLGIEKGPEYDPDIPVSTEPPYLWSILVRCGELEITLIEGRPDISVKIGTTEKSVVLPPSPTRPGSGYTGSIINLTVIPVWNGILLSDTPPGSSNWEDRVVFIKKSREDSILSHVNTKFQVAAQPAPPRYGPLGEFLPRDRFGVIGCFVDNQVNMRVDMGQTLIVEFERCGGTLQFIPVYFTRRIKSYYFLRGANPPGGLAGVCPDNVDVPSTYTVPMFYYDVQDAFTSWVKFRIFSGATPAYCLMSHFTRGSSGYRRPLETWGAVLYYVDAQQAVEGDPGFLSEGSILFRNAEGFLTVNDLPSTRIRDVSISRSLDGCSGNITWDRYDPAVGLAVRPPQNVGALRIAVVGGVDTIGGTIFTGIAMGNAEQDSPDSNTIQVPLHGRECKMTDSEGGMRIINTPPFDGDDHREAIKWMCDFAGVPFISFSSPYRLPVGEIMQPVIDVKTGTPVWDAIGEICKHSATLVFFDRFGVLRQYNVGQTSGINWVYPTINVKSYDDKPDLTTVRNAILVAGLVRTGEIRRERLQDGTSAQHQAMMVAINVPTFPEFPWTKMMFYAIPGILAPGELRRAAVQIALGVQRPRASGSVTIPGNANVELLDTFNTAWAITGITQNISTQGKEFTTTLNLEYLLGIAEANPVSPPPGGHLMQGASRPPEPLPILGEEYNSDEGISDLNPEPEESPLFGHKIED